MLYIISTIVYFFRCTCDEGYTGQNCESEYIPCSPSPCQNGGKCRQTDKHSYTCDCMLGKILIIYINTIRQENNDTHKILVRAPLSIFQNYIRSSSNTV